MFDGFLNKWVPGSEMAEEEEQEEAATGSNGTMRAAMAARRRKNAKNKAVGSEQETASESREELLDDSYSQQARHMETAESGVPFETDSQRSECIISEQKFKSEQELCCALRHEVAAAATAKEQAYHIAEMATGQMERLKDRCLQLQELVHSLQAALEVNQPSREQSASELCQHQSHNSECSNTELQTESNGTEVARLAVPSPHVRKGSSSSADAQAPGQDEYLEEANTFDLSERLLQDECDELRQEISHAALAEKREQDTAEMHQDQVRRLQRSVQRLQEQARRPRHAFHEAAIAAQAESKKHGGVQRMKRLEDLGESSSNFLFI